MFLSPTGYLTISFVLLLFFLGKRVYKGVLALLDARILSIKKSIHHAEKVKEDAEKILKAMRTYQDDVLHQIQAIKSHATSEADRLTVDSRGKLDDIIEQGEKLTSEQIARAEKKVLEDIRLEVIDKACFVVEDVLRHAEEEAFHYHLIDEALATLSTLEMKETLSPAS